MREVLISAARTLLDRLPELTARLVAEIEGGQAGQRCVPGDTGTRYRLAHEGLRAGLEAIIHPQPPRPDLAYAEQLGRTHADRGLPLDSLLRAYRLAGWTLWEALLEVVAAEQPDKVGLLVHNVPRSWQTIDLQSTVATNSYRARRAELLRQESERAGKLLDALLDGRGLDATATVAAALGLPERGGYAVVVLSPAGARHDEEDERTLAGGARLVWRRRPDTEVGVLYLGTTDLDVAVEAVSGEVRGAVGVSPKVGGLAELGRARWLAELALRTCTGSEPTVARLEERLPAVLLAGQPELAGYLLDHVLGTVLALDRREREPLLAALRAWLDCHGSTARAAARLRCHPNTVLNRVHRVEALTGRSRTNPADLVELSLALSALELDPPALGTTSGTGAAGSSGTSTAASPARD